MQIVTAAAHLGALAGAEDGGQLNDKLAFFAQPKLLVIDALGYLLLEQRGAHLQGGADPELARRGDRLPATLKAAESRRNGLGEPGRDQDRIRLGIAP